MSQRDFDFTKVFDSGMALSGLVIHCSKCPSELTYVQRGSMRRPPDAAEQWFRHKGWTVGQRKNSDLCPSCADARRRLRIVRMQQREEKGTEDAAMGRKTTVFGADTTMLSSAPETVLFGPEVNGKGETIRAEAPRSMTREDRRIINDKLDAVYEKDRYAVPWSDAKVARDLGVPQAWIAEVRDLLFGPEGSNPEIDGFLEKLEPMMAEAKSRTEEARRQGVEINRKAEELQKLAADAAGKLQAAQGLVRAVGDLTTRIGDLELLATKLRKETGK